MFQIGVNNLVEIEAALAAVGWPLYAGPREAWREVGDRESGSREIFVQDPDGYLVMLAEKLSERPLPQAK